MKKFIGILLLVLGTSCATSDFVLEDPTGHYKVKTAKGALATSKDVRQLMDGETAASVNDRGNCFKEEIVEGGSRRTLIVSGENCYQDLTAPSGGYGSGSLLNAYGVVGADGIRRAANFYASGGGVADGSSSASPETEKRIEKVEKKLDIVLESAAKKKKAKKKSEGSR